MPLIFKGNFNTEKAKLNAIGESVGGSLASLKTVVTELSKCWKDSESANFITEANAFIEEIETKLKAAVEGGNETLDSVASQFHIYNG